jgi:tetratricopeptide (TPR) repeat protein
LSENEELAGPETQSQQHENEPDFLTESEETKFNTDESVFNVKIPEEKEEEKPFGEETPNLEKNDDGDEDLAILFEPLHTVDYFASQGIKLTEEALNNDQLGKQVKSFTAWLKSMKKLHPGQLPEQNVVIEKLIQTSSEASNKNANVLTEAMANVLVKQGKSEKAIEMYEKLSLINPSKSAYFAAKIKSLKII